MPERSPFPLDVLEFDLDERRTFIKDHDEEMEYICACLSHYYEDVKHAIDYGLSHSVVSHFTYNLVLVLAKGLTSLTIYEYMRGAYLLEEDFDNVYKTWKSVHDSAEEIIPLLVNLENENYFDEDVEMEDFIMDILPPHCKKAKGFEKLLNLHRRVALRTGSSLITTLSCYIRHMEQWLIDLKNGIYTNIEEEYDRVYWANYNLYKNKYWPIDGRDFRMNVQNDNFLSVEITPEFLAKCLWEEKRNFEQTPTGQLRRDFINNKKDLYYEVKRISLNEEQWRYFFKSICRFEEYQKWMEELRNPPESDEDKEKRELLLRSNSIFDIQKMKVKRIDILRLYIFIKDHFIKDNMKAYLWYALRRYFDKLDILLDDCSNVAFEEQMNKSEWFEDAPKPCSDNEMNNYNFLNGKHCSLWLSAEIPRGSRATPTGLRNIYKVYSDLELNEKELMR